MLRLLFFLLMLYFVFRAMRYFAKIFLSQTKMRKNSGKDYKEIVDIDYEEVKDEKDSNQQK